MTKGEQEFVELLRRASEIVADSNDLADAEPLFDQVLVMILRERVGRQFAGTELLSMWRNNMPGAGEVVGYCMHTLVWEEVRKGLQDDLEHHPNFRTRDGAARVLKSFHNEWDDAIFYQRYRSEVEWSE